MRRFHSLTVERIDEETADSRRIVLRVPAVSRGTFDFIPGQHLPVQISVDGRHVRRTYSICAAPAPGLLEIGVRVQPHGVFSGFVAGQLAVGDTLAVMPPTGRFQANADPAHSKTRLMFAAGSGITPILAMMRAVLDGEPSSRVALFYGNRQQRTTMFIDDLYALKNRYPARVQLYFLFSREQQAFPVFSGRLDAAKVTELVGRFCTGLRADEAYICGPGNMIEAVGGSLRELGLDSSHIHAEHYGAPRVTQAVADDTPAGAGEAEITVVMDGHRTRFVMPRSADTVVDAAAQHGIDLPYSCKAGVCATCRTFLREGRVRMDATFGLEPWELKKGYILACQSRPLSRALTLDYDRS